MPPTWLTPAHGVLVQGFTTCMQQRGCRESTSASTALHWAKAGPGKRALVVDGSAVGDAADLHVVQQRRHKGRAVVQVGLRAAMSGSGCRSWGCRSLAGTQQSQARRWREAQHLDVAASIACRDVGEGAAGRRAPHDLHACMGMCAVLSAAGMLHGIYVPPRPGGTADGSRAKAMHAARRGSLLTAASAPCHVTRVSSSSHSPQTPPRLGRGTAARRGWRWGRTAPGRSGRSRRSRSTRRPTQSRHLCWSPLQRRPTAQRGVRDTVSTRRLPWWGRCMAGMRKAVRKKPWHVLPCAHGPW